MTVQPNHRHKNTKGLWVTGVADGDHTHPEVEAEKTRAMIAEGKLATRIALLEGLMPQSPPPVTPPPVTPPPTTTPKQVPSGPLTFTKDGQVIENVVIDLRPGGPITFSDQYNGGNRIYGKGFKGCGLRNVTIRGGYVGIQLVDMDDFRWGENVIVTDCDYAGAEVWGGVGGKIINPTIQRIGELRTPAIMANVGDGMPHPQANNAYGIIFGVSSGIHGANGRGQVPTDWLLSGGTITDSPLWMLVNAHEATRLTVEGMFLRRAPRAVFMAGQIIDCIVRNNDIAIPVTKSGGSQDVESVLYSGWTRGSITGNKIGAPYPMPAGYGSQVIAPTVSGNVRV